MLNAKKRNFLPASPPALKPSALNLNCLHYALCDLLALATDGRARAKRLFLNAHACRDYFRITVSLRA